VTQLPATNAPTMKKLPWAKLTMRVTPNTSVNPAAIMNSVLAWLRPFKHWISQKLI
jgi:hypothetical protein